MIYTTQYKSPLWQLFLASKDNKLIWLRIQWQKFFPSNFQNREKKSDLEIFDKTKQRLDLYFHDKNPDPQSIPLKLIWTEFRKSVWKELLLIQYWQTMTYKDISQNIAKQRWLSTISAQAVGWAIWHNPISIIIPCHRVIWSNGSLTWYAWWIDNKKWLLSHEWITQTIF